MARVLWQNTENGATFSSSVYVPEEIQATEDKGKALAYANEHRNSEHIIGIDITLDNEAVNWKDVDEACGDDNFARLNYVAGRYGRSEAMRHCSELGMSSWDAYEELYGESRAELMADYDNDREVEYYDDYEEEEE